MFANLLNLFREFSRISASVALDGINVSIGHIGLLIGDATINFDHLGHLSTVMEQSNEDCHM